MTIKLISISIHSTHKIVGKVYHDLGAATVEITESTSGLKFNGQISKLIRPKLAAKRLTLDGIYQTKSITAPGVYPKKVRVLFWTKERRPKK